MKKILLVTLPIILIVSACNFVSGKKVRGNGDMKTEERNVTSFRGVNTNGSFDIYVSSGPQQVRIEGEENLLQYIESDIDNGILRFRTRDGIRLRPTKDVKIYVTNPSYSEIHSSGSGNIIGQNKITSSDKLEVKVSGSADVNLDVDAPSVEANISGSGDMDLKGNTRTFETRINGSGNVRAIDLKSEETTVKINGSGDVSVFASVKLKVTVAGSGEVRYKGNATVESKITGGGGVSKVD